MIAMAVSERKNSKLDSAMARCEEAMTIAMEKHDRAPRGQQIVFSDEIFHMLTQLTEPARPTVY